MVEGDRATNGWLDSDNEPRNVFCKDNGILKIRFPDIATEFNSDLCMFLRRYSALNFCSQVILNITHSLASHPAVMEATATCK